MRVRVSPGIQKYGREGQLVAAGGLISHYR
jgi:hypothetical protein